MKKPLLFSFLVCMITLSFAQNEFHLDETYYLSLDGTIYLTSDDAKVSIRGGDRNDVHIKISRIVETIGITLGNKEFAVDITESQGDLRIIERKQKGQVSIVGYYQERYTIEIDAPYGASLNFRGDDDDYRIEDINGDIEIRIDDGDATLIGCGGSYFSFDIDDGDIEMDQGKGKLSIKADDGDILVENGSFDELDIDVDDGDVNIETSLAENGDYYIRANDSDISLNITHGGGVFEIRHDDTRVTSSSKFNLLEENESFSRLKLPSGGAVFRIRVDDGHVRLNSY